MTKQLYEEALADVRKVKEVAEADAKRAIMEAVTPRIRDLIERELLREHGDDLDDDDVAAPGAPSIDGELMTDLVAPSPDAAAPADAITPPDAQGKVTLDLDALTCEPAGVAVAAPVFGEPAPLPGDEYEISLESIEALTPVLNGTRNGVVKEFERRLGNLGEAINKIKKADRKVRESAGLRTQITKMISRVEDMYEYVQESVADLAKKSSYETKLETFFKELNRLQEQTMSKQTKKQMNEADVTLKLTGLPDDIDLDSVGVDMVTGEEEAGEEGGEDMGGEDMGGDAGDLGDLDLGGDQGGGGEQMESRALSDDTIVEIDEGMLRREIARMRKLREEAVPSNAGNGVDAKAMDDFGGGSDQGEPLDQEIADQSDAPAALPLGEADDMDEGDQMDELDQVDEGDDDEEKMDEGDLTQLGLKRKEEEHGADAANSHSVAAESLSRRAAFEKRIQERAKARAAALKKEAARSAKDSRKMAALQKEYAEVAKRFNESLDRSKKISKLMAEAKASNGSTKNGAAARPAETQAVSLLRKKLAETNLFNAKLLFTNKLLQNESLSAKQKSRAIEQLEAAKTVNEAKLVYESLTKVAGGSAQVNENKDRKVLGSASRATRPASTQTLNEGFESERWAKLAGIVK
jgi:hypothetical protein